MTTLDKLEDLLHRGMLRSCFSTVPKKAFGIEISIDTPKGRLHWKTPPCTTLAEAIELAWEHAETQGYQ